MRDRYKLPLCQKVQAGRDAPGTVKHREAPGCYPAAKDGARRRGGRISRASRWSRSVARILLGRFRPFYRYSARH
ncbi:hypothetical protein ABH935_007948 [Catenulispora sp. GAS73]